eukprot:g17333.t1
MLVEHPEYGQLLRRARKRKGGLASGCVLSPERLQMYQQVVELCHRRIYKENLESLWDGEADKLPTMESIEAAVQSAEAVRDAWDHDDRTFNLSRSNNFCRQHSTLFGPTFFAVPENLTVTCLQSFGGPILPGSWRNMSCPSLATASESRGKRKAAR